MDRQLARELKALAHHDDPYDTVVGKTMCCSDFYEGQGRLDGAFCDFSETEKMEYLTHVHSNNVLNIEMESLAFAALTHHAGIKSAVVCVTMLDRLKGDQVIFFFAFFSILSSYYFFSISYTSLFLSICKVLIIIIKN